MRKVALFLDHPRKGNRRHHIQLKALNEAGFDPRIIILSGDPRDSYLARKGHLNRFLSLNFSRYEAFNHFSIKVIPKLIHLIKEENISLVLTQRWRLLKYLWLIKPFVPRLKIVFYLVIGGVFRSPGRRLTFKLLYPLCDRLLVNSRALREELSALGISRERIGILYSAVDPGEFDLSLSKEEVRRAFGFPEDFLFGMVARFRREKDHVGLLRAFQKFVEEGGEGHLVLVGDGPREDEIRRLSLELGLSERVIFTGRLPMEKIPLVLRAFDVFVYATFREGMPMAVMEAMAARLPIIATDAEGIPDLFETQRSFGIMVPKGDSEALARAMKELYFLPPEKRQALGKEARERIKEAFSPEILARETVKIVREVLNV